jgi:hypothetical protein
VAESTAEASMNILGSSEVSTERNLTQNILTVVHAVSVHSWFT